MNEVRNQNQKISDDDLVKIARGDLLVSSANDMPAQMADELLRLRRAARGDSRRADQVRRLRWQAETLTTKAEELIARVRSLGGETETLNDIANEEPSYTESA